jgi:hypothetical protein
MSRRIKQDDHDKQDGNGPGGGFFSRWSARKSQIVKGEPVPEEAPLPLADDGTALTVNDEVEDDEDAALTDAELLEKYELPDPEDVTEETGLDRFMSGDMPERLRQMALRRLWRLNPMFGIVDDMVEYGEDYTDAAVVIEGMQTAYTAGKGYASKAVEPEEIAEAEDQVEDGPEDKSEDRQDDQAEEAKQDNAVTDASDDAGKSAENGAEDAQKQPAIAADGNPEGDDSVSAKIPHGLPYNPTGAHLVLPDMAEMAPDLVAVMPSTPVSNAFEPASETAASAALTAPYDQTEKSNNTDENQTLAWRPARMSFHKK